MNDAEALAVELHNLTTGHFLRWPPAIRAALDVGITPDWIRLNAHVGPAGLSAVVGLANATKEPTLT